MIKKFNLYIYIFLIFSACGSGFNEAKKVLKNEKIYTTDEFLVKKKEPLVLPPDFDEIPIPDSKTEIKTEVAEKEKIRKILDKENKKIKNKTTSSSLEKNILKKIK